MPTTAPRFTIQRSGQVVHVYGHTIALPPVTLPRVRRTLTDRPAMRRLQPSAQWRGFQAARRRLETTGSLSTTAAPAGSSLMGRSIMIGDSPENIASQLRRSARWSALASLAIVALVILLATACTRFAH